MGNFLLLTSWLATDERAVITVLTRISAFGRLAAREIFTLLFRGEKRGACLFKWVVKSKPNSNLDLAV